MTRKEAYALGKSIMMMEFEETAVTGCVVRRPYADPASAAAKPVASKKPDYRRTRRRPAVPQ